MVRDQFPDSFQHPGLRRADDVHHVFGRAPSARYVDHFFIKIAALFEPLHFEIGGARVGCQRQNDRPFAVEAEERVDRVASHVRRQRHPVGQILAEKGAGVHLRRIADIAPFGVGDNHDFGIVIPDISHRFDETFPAFRAVFLVKSEVGLVAYGVCRRGVDDRPVEGENRIVFGQQALRDFVRIGVQAYAQETAFPPDLFEKFR